MDIKKPQLKSVEALFSVTVNHVFMTEHALLK